ncbi:MAG: hypothetical protein KGL39_54670, partial [Patescibacteria group bacterium]|nr:hypothetical protein [Patescibacteria group bacterium]
MLIGFKRGQTSVVLRVKIFDSTATTGAGKTGLTNATSGLIISTIADNEATATVYTVAASNVETITTLGTYAAPTSGKCRFKEVDATNHKGIYELQIADARFAVTSAKFLTISISGATGAAECDAVIPLTAFDMYGATTANLSFAGGVTITNSTSNGDGLSITGNGTGAGMRLTGGATGNGMALIGGSTSGSSFLCTTTSGHCIDLTATGTAKHGISSVGSAASGANAGGHGMQLTGGAATTTSGGTAGRGLDVLGGVGAALTNSPGVGTLFQAGTITSSFGGATG